mgnify:CR=1 FL=1
MTMAGMSIFDISGRAMSAQLLRLNTTASNLANAGSVANSEKGAFRARKHFEHALHAIFPRSFTPLYNMVSFSTVPYAEAKRRAERQNRAIGLAGMVATGALLALVVLAVRALL